MAAVAVLLCACQGNATTQNSKQGDELCQFRNIDRFRAVSYIDNEDKTGYPVDSVMYVNNQFTAVWPVMINGKPCKALQRALLDEMVYDIYCAPDTQFPHFNDVDSLIDYCLKCQFPSDGITELDKPVSDTVRSLSASTHLSVMSLDRQMLTMKCEKYEYAGGAHGATEHSYYTYDIDNDRVLQFNDVVADTTMFKQLTLQAFKDDPDISVENLWLPKDGMPPLPNDFYIDTEDKGLHAIYQQYEIASYAQGIIDATIALFPLDDKQIKQLLTPRAQQLLGFEK